MPSKLSSAFLLPFLASAAFATPSSQCKGSCTIEQRNVVRNQIPHTVHINGPSHMVADLSRSSGWELLDCPQDWSKGSANVRLVCTHEDGSETCDHIHEGGAENTIVRLPADCGTGPFARVAQWGVARDQLIPSGSIADHKLRRRSLTPPVFAARLDYNFRAIPQERGEVSFDITAAHHPEINDNIKHAHHVPRAIREAMYGSPTPSAFAAPTNSIFGIDLPTKLPDIDIPIPTKLPDLPISIPTKLPDLPISIPTKLPDLPSIPIPIPTKFPDIKIPFDEFPMPDLPTLEGGFEKSKGFEAIKLQGNHSLVDESLGCNFGKIGFDQSAKISVETDILINAGYALKIAGKVVPPEVNDFALAGALSGKIHAVLNVDMYLSADILFPPVKLLGIGVPGLSVPGLFTIGPEAVLQATLDLAVDVSFAARIPLTYDFQKLDFVFPNQAAEDSSEAQESKKTSSFEASVSPGEQTGSIGLHVIPKLEFGIEILHDLAHAEVYVGLDTDITFASNGTVFPDFSYEGCQDVSYGLLAKAGVSAGAFKFLNVGQYKTLWEKRHTLWQHCSKAADGPATAIYKDEDGSYTNAGGDLVNENGQLVDENGQVIPDEEAADAPPPPIKGDDGQDIPEEDIILENGDGTWEDSQGNPTNQDGQRISNNGTVLGCELDTSQPLLDAEGKVIPPEEAIYDLGDGKFSNGNCDIVNADGQLIDDDGNVIDYEDFKDENGQVIPPGEVVIDNEDGTFSDPYGNPVDQWGGAMDFDENGDIIPVELTPVEDDDGTQEEREPEVTEDPAFTIMTPEQLEQLALDLIHGKPPAPLPSDTTTSTESTPTDTASPPADTPSTDAPSTETTSTETEPTSAPETQPTDAPAPETPTDTTSSESSTSTESSPSEEPTLNPNPIPAPAPATPSNACKAPAKRAITSPGHVSLFSTPPISTNHKRRRTLSGRAGSFGCTMPSIGGLPLFPALPGLDQLARVF